MSRGFEQKYDMKNAPDYRKKSEYQRMLSGPTLKDQVQSDCISKEESMVLSRGGGMSYEDKSVENFLRPQGVPRRNMTAKSNLASQKSLTKSSGGGLQKLQKGATTGESQMEKLSESMSSMQITNN